MWVSVHEPTYIYNGRVARMFLSLSCDAELHASRTRQRGVPEAEPGFFLLFPLRVSEALGSARVSAKGVADLVGKRVLRSECLWTRKEPATAPTDEGDPWLILAWGETASNQDAQ